MKIKFISKIEEVDHYGNPNYYRHEPEEEPRVVPVGVPYELTSVEVETCEIKEFVRNGVSYFYAWTREIGELFKLPMEVFYEMEKQVKNKTYQLESEKENTKSLACLVEVYENLSFWQRLKFLFMGRI